MVYKQPKSRFWSYRFTWQGREIRKSTKVTNKRDAEDIERAVRTALAKGEVGIIERKPAPTLKAFVEGEFKNFIESQFANKPKTLEYYGNGIKNLAKHEPLARLPLDGITAEKIAGFIASRREAGLQVTSINRQLEVLRRALKLAVEWGKIDKVPPKVAMLPGERHRERVLSVEEEKTYLAAAVAVGETIQRDYAAALIGTRAQRGETPLKPTDPFLLRDVTTLLIDCGMRPEECFRLRWEEVRDGAVHVLFGKTENARRTIPLTPRAAAILDMRRAERKSQWVFPAPTRSGHIEKSSLKKQHAKACEGEHAAANAKATAEGKPRRYAVRPFQLYTLRHTCLTRWAAYMDPYTLGYLAGHSDFATTKRYVHPQVETVRAAMERARLGQGRHTSRHTDEMPALQAQAESAAIQ